jgi:hypothetical protein
MKEGCQIPVLTSNVIILTCSFLYIPCLVIFKQIVLIIINTNFSFKGQCVSSKNKTPS